MADSKRETVITAFDTRLKTILVAGGYETDAGKNVYGWKDTPLEQTKLPALVWRDTDEAAPIAGQTDDHTLRVEVDCVVVKTTSVSAMKQLRKLIADVVKVLGTDLTLGGVVHDIVQQGEEMQVTHEDKKVMASTATFELLFTTGHFDPYV